MQYSSSTSSPSSRGGGLQLSPLLVILIVLTHTPSSCQAWTNAPLLSSRFQQQQQQHTSLYEVNGNYQQNVGITNGYNDDGEASIMEIANALTTTTTIPQQQSDTKEVNGFVEKAQQAWTSPLNDTTSNRMPPTTTDNNNNTNQLMIDANTYKTEEEKYLTLAKEAWNEFFSEQLSQEEFLNMALDAWRDNAATLLQQQQDVVVGSEFVEEVGQLDSSVEDQQEEYVEVNGNVEEVNGNFEVNGSAQAQDEVMWVEEEDQNDETATTTEQKKWGINAGMSFLSGLFSESKQQSSEALADTTLLAEETNEEEDLPYGLRMMKSSSSASVLPPSSPSSPAMDDISSAQRERGGNNNALSNDDISSMKAKSSGKEQVTPPIKKGFSPPLKSFDKKQFMPPPSPINKGIMTQPPMMNKGVITKGKEKTSFGGGGGNKLSSSPPPSFVNKGGSKLGIQGKKLTPKKLDMVTKKTGPQGSRGGLSFLKSDKLSKKYNPMNKGVTVEKLKGLKIGQVVVKSKGIVEEVSKVQLQADTSKATLNGKKLYPATTLISEGMTAEEAEIVRNNRLSTEDVIASLLEKVALDIAPPVASTETTTRNDYKPMAITEGMTAEEAERARMARLEISDTMKEKIKPRTEKKGGVGTMPLKTAPVNGPLSKTPGTPKVVSKGVPLKGGIISAGATQPKQSPSFGIDSTVKKSLPPLPLKQPVAKKGFPPPPPIAKTAPSFSMEKKSLGPMPLKRKGDDAGLKKGMGLPPLAKKSFGDGVTPPTIKKAFPSAPLKMKGPMSKASTDDEANADDSSVLSKGLPLKGGMSMGENQAGLPGKGMPFMKKAPSFSIEKKSLPPLPLKGKGDGGGLKKGMDLPHFAKKSTDKTTPAPMMKKAFPSAPLKMKGPMSKASADGVATADDSSVPKGLPLKGGMSMVEKQGGPPGKGISKSENEIPTAGLPLEAKSSDDEKSDLKSTTATPEKPDKSEAKSIATNSQPATLLISEGMTADEAEKIRKNRLLTEEEKASKTLDETIQPADTPTAITDGMTAEEAERARLARDTIAIDMAALQSRIRQLDPAPTATTRTAQESTSREKAELKQLKATTARIETKLESVLSQIDNLESKIEVLDKENLQLRRENIELREELEDLKRSVALLDAFSEIGQ